MARRLGVRIAVPAVTVVALVWLMVGCVYVPWFEHRDLAGAKTDFRDLSGKSSADPIADGHITEDQVTRLLGEPRARSPNGRVIAYAMTTRHGFWVAPMCLGLNVTPGGRHLYAVGLRFNSDGVLEHHCFVAEGIALDLLSPTETERDHYQMLAARRALRGIDEDNGVVQAGPGRRAVREDYSVVGFANIVLR